MSSPPVRTTPSTRRTISASSTRSLVLGRRNGMPPAWRMDCSYLKERLTERSLNSTPRFSMLGETRIKGGLAIARNVKPFEEIVSGKSCAVLWLRLKIGVGKQNQLKPQRG